MNKETIVAENEVLLKELEEIMDKFTLIWQKLVFQWKIIAR